MCRQPQSRQRRHIEQRPIVFVLQEFSAPREFDGQVNFTWLARHFEFALQARPPGCFLELRLGYPVADPEKRLTIRGPAIAGTACELSIRRGWNSYFVRLTEGGPAPCELAIDKPLVVSGDTRFLGVMLSYLAVTDDAARVREIEQADREIDAAVRRRAEFACAGAWGSWLRETIVDRESEFYEHRALDVPTAAALRDPVRRFSVLYKREKWIIDRLAGGLVLEIGCGRGGLVQARDKGCRLVGIDLSPVNCATAQRGGYDVCLHASGTHLPLADASVDHVVSADVLGHVPAEQKERLVAETQRVLKPGGTCLHLIETDEFDPEQMAAEDFARMVLIDGHIGIVGKQATERLFASYFDLLECFLVGNVSMSLAHWVRAHDLYGTNLPGEVLSRLLNASPAEREFFDLGAGWTFWRLLAERYCSAGSGGLLFVHARKRSA